jgi:hypothetical protein
MKPRVACDEESISWNVKGIDPDAVVRVCVVVVELGIDQSPATLLGVPELRHLMVQTEPASRAQESETRARSNNPLCLEAPPPV